MLQIYEVAKKTALTHKWPADLKPQLNKYDL